MVYGDSPGLMALLRLQEHTEKQYRSENWWCDNTVTSACHLGHAIACVHHYAPEISTGSAKNKAPM